MDSVTKWWQDCPIKHLLLILIILYAWSSCTEKKVETPVIADKKCTPEKTEATSYNPTDFRNQQNRYGHYTPQYRPLSEEMPTRYRSFSSPYQSQNYYNQNGMPPVSNQRNLVVSPNPTQNTWQQPTPSVNPYSPNNYQSYIEQPSVVPPYYNPNQYNNNPQSNQ